VSGQNGKGRVLLESLVQTVPVICFNAPSTPYFWTVFDTLKENELSMEFLLNVIEKKLSRPVEEIGLFEEVLIASRERTQEKPF
jgi:hypothetical protein